VSDAVARTGRRDDGWVTWTFRNRIELRPHCRLEYEGPEWVIDESGSGKRVKLVGRYLREVQVIQLLQGGPGAALDGPPMAPIKDATRLILIGTGYASEEEALAAGELWRGSLMRAFATLNVAADFGDASRPTGGFTPEGLNAASRGRRAFNDPLELWSYEDDDGEEPLFFVSNGIDGWFISSPHERLEGALAEATEMGGLSQTGRVSYDLYAGSFGLGPEPRFAMLMTAFESLLTPKPRSAEAQAHVRSMIEATRTSELPSSEIQSICGSLNWLLDQSISQAGRELAWFLGPRDYLNGEEPGKFFTKCYEVRSRLLHGKHPIPTQGELGQLAAPLERLVSELIARLDR
jgi:hypothetical protein